MCTNTSGPRRLVVGTARDLLIGITVVRADGVIAKAGGKVVKNVAGYDLGKLVVGSFGTLAVVTEAVFRCHPAPVASRWLSKPVSDPAEAHTVVQSVLHAQAVPSAIEVEWPGEGEGPGAVHVLLEGRDRGVEGRAATIRSLLGGDTTETADDPAGGATYPWDTTATGEDRATCLKLTFVLSALPEVLAAAREHDLHVRGSAGAGVVYAAFAQGTLPQAVAAALPQIRQTCARAGGSAVVVDAPASVKSAVDVWGPVPALDLMRRVKDQFDPDHRLAPGRFVGGL